MCEGRINLNKKDNKHKVFTRKALGNEKQKVTQNILKNSIQLFFFCNLFIKQHFSKILISHVQKMYNNIFLISFDNYDLL